MSEDKVQAAARAYDTWDGKKVMAAQAAALSIPRRGDGAAQYTDKVDHLLLADGSEVYVCTEGDCSQWGYTLQSIVVSHRPRVHPETISRQTRVAHSLRSDYADLLKRPMVEVFEEYLKAEDRYVNLLERLNRQIRLTGEEKAARRKAEKELKDIQDVFAKLGLKFSK